MTVTESAPTLKDGRVVAIAGPVIDVEFPPDAVPQINTMLSFDITIDGKPNEVRAEVRRGGVPRPPVLFGLLRWRGAR